MIWGEVVKKFGVKTAKKMEKSKYLQGITVSINEKEEADIPERDIILAYKDVKGKKIYEQEWD